MKELQKLLEDNTRNELPTKEDAYKAWKDSSTKGKIKVTQNAISSLTAVLAFLNIAQIPFDEFVDFCYTEIKKEIDHGGNPPSTH